jgi:hypothetical protein
MHASLKKTRASLPLYRSNLPQSPATLPPGSMDRCEAVPLAERASKTSSPAAGRRASRELLRILPDQHALLSPPESSRNQARKKFCDGVQHLHLDLTRASQTWPHAYSKTQ